MLLVRAKGENTTGHGGKEQADKGWDTGGGGGGNSWWSRSDSRPGVEVSELSRGGAGCCFLSGAGAPGGSRGMRYERRAMRSSAGSDFF